MAHVDQLQECKPFSTFKAYENFVPKSKFRKDDGLLKYWGRLQSNLIFILYVKDAAATLLSDFKPINVELMEMVEMDEVKRWVEKRKEELKREEKKKPIIEKPMEKMVSVSPSTHRDYSEPKVYTP